MRIVNLRWWLPVLALVVACGMHHPRHHMMRGMGCGPDACGYQSKCFSEGAVRSNDGVCQSCSGGKWVATSGCRDHGGGDCCAMHGDGAPCPHRSEPGHRHTK